MTNLNWKEDLKRYNFILGNEAARDHPKDIIKFESLYDGEVKTDLGIALIQGKLTGWKSYKMYVFVKGKVHTLGVGGENDEPFVKSACEFEYKKDTLKLKHPFEAQVSGNYGE